MAGETLILKTQPLARRPRVDYSRSVRTALRFFFTVTLDRADVIKHLTFVPEPRKMPVILSPEEVARFLERRRSASPMGRACACLRSPR